MRTDLYRAFDLGGRLLYVGVSLSAIGRLGAHRNQSEWFPEAAQIKIEHHPTREAALAAEATAIKTENPLFNVVGGVNQRFMEARIYTEQGFREFNEGLREIGGGLSIYEIFGLKAAKAALDRELIYERIHNSKSIEEIATLELRADQIMRGNPHYDRAVKGFISVCRIALKRNAQNNKGSMRIRAAIAVSSIARQREASLRGQERARAAGVRFGRKPKLSSQQCAEAIARRESGEPQSEIARAFGVDQSTISRLRIDPVQESVSRSS